MSIPNPDRMPGMGEELTFEQIAAAEAQHNDGHVYVTCQAHGGHHIPAVEAEVLTDAFLALGPDAAPDLCPLTLLEDPSA